MATDSEIVKLWEADSENQPGPSNPSILRSGSTLQLALIADNLVEKTTPELPAKAFFWLDLYVEISRTTLPRCRVILISRRYILGRKAPIVVTTKMNWISIIKNIRKSDTWWSVLFAFAPGQVSFKLPARPPKASRLVFPFNPGQALPPGTVVITPQRAVNVLTQPVPRKPVNRPPRRMVSGSFAKAPSRPNPEIVTVPRRSGSESYVTPYGGVITEVEFYYKSRTGTRTPGFRFKKKQQLPVNPYSQVVRNTKNRQAYYIDVKTPPVTQEWFADNRPTAPNHYTPPAAPVHSGRAVNKAIDKLVKRTDTELHNIAQDLAQASQTSRLITNTVDRLRFSVQFLKKKNFASAINSLVSGKRQSVTKGKWNLKTGNTLAQNWLELQYGWKPLLSDIAGLTNAISALCYPQMSIRTVRASALDKSYTSSKVPMIGHPSLTIGKEEVLLTSKCKIGMRFRMSNPMLAFASQTGFTNPLNLGWEILPYSFVLDWLLPIGPYLEGLSSFEGLEFLDGFQSNLTRQNTFTQIAFRGPHYSDPTYERTLKGGYDREWCNYDRVKLTTFPRNRLPSFKNPFSVDHTLNALALLRTAMKR